MRTLEKRHNKLAWKDHFKAVLVEARSWRPISLRPQKPGNNQARKDRRLQLLDTIESVDPINASIRTTWGKANKRAWKGVWAAWLVPVLAERCTRD